MAELLNHLTRSPLLLADAKSAILVLLGIALGLLAIIDVAAMRDLYPGYSTIGRERQHAIDHYAEENARSLAAMMHLRDQTVEDMSSAIELIRGSQFEMQQSIDGRTRLHHNLRAYFDHLAVVHERLIQRYRESNRREYGEGKRRRTSGAPPTRPTFVDAPVLASLAAQELDVRSEVIARIDYYIKAINEKFEQTMPEYQTVGQLATLGSMELAPA